LTGEIGRQDSTRAGILASARRHRISFQHVYPSCTPYYSTCGKGTADRQLTRKRKGVTREFWVYEGTQLLRGEMDDQTRQDMMLRNCHSLLNTSMSLEGYQRMSLCIATAEGDLMRNIVA